MLRAGLDVSLIDKALHVPVDATLNAVRAPDDAEKVDKTALTVVLDGVDHGRPVNVARARVATARAVADSRTAVGYANLAHAVVRLPGLRGCPRRGRRRHVEGRVRGGKRPAAESNVLGGVTVLGKRVSVSVDGTTRVRVPGVGEVRLDLSRATTTKRGAAATALDLRFEVNPSSSTSPRCRAGHTRRGELRVAARPGRTRRFVAGLGQVDRSGAGRGGSSSGWGRWSVVGPGVAVRSRAGRGGP
ncbi:hypothetical protein NKH77_13080 [Streptomyces sp. M19]